MKQKFVNFINSHWLIKTAFLIGIYILPLFMLYIWGNLYFLIFNERLSLMPQWCTGHKLFAICPIASAIILYYLPSLGLIWSYFEQSLIKVLHSALLIISIPWYGFGIVAIAFSSL